MADPLVAFLFTSIVATLPIYAGLLLPLGLTGRREGTKKPFLFGLGIGVLFASFFDLTKGTAGISTSTLKSALDLFNVVALAGGLLAFFLVHVSVKKERDDGSSLSSLYLWALLGIGFHGAGEGVVIGYDFTTGATILSLSQISSFVLHKGAEGFTLGLLLTEGSRTWRHGALSGLLSGFPTGIGTLAGIYGISAISSTLLFAVGAGATTYMTIRFASLSGSSSSKTIIGVLLGFLFMYVSGVLHQFE